MQRCGDGVEAPILNGCHRPAPQPEVMQTARL